MASTAKKPLTLKLLVQTQSNAPHRVLFAEATKEVIDFLFALLSLPLASVTRLLAADRMVGSVGNLYTSVETLDDTYMINPNEDKESLLKPKIDNPSSTLPLHSLLEPHLFLPSLSTTEVANNKYYSCNYGRCSSGYITDDAGTCCPGCRQTMRTELKYVNSGVARIEEATAEAGGGYVKDVMVYMVMDDLKVMPMSTISAIGLLGKFRASDVSSLSERIVEIGMQEGLQLLRASLCSTTVLTDTFLAKKE